MRHLTASIHLIAVNNEVEVYGRKVLWPNARYCSGRCWGIKENTKYLHRNLNWVPLNKMRSVTSRVMCTELSVFDT